MRFPDEKIIVDELMEQARTTRGLEQFESRVGAHQYLRLYHLVHDYVLPGGSVLDWGTGNGHFSYFLLRSGFTATGYALHPCSFADRMPDAGYRFVVGNASEPTRLPFPAAHFDAVVSVGVLEHVREEGGNELGSLVEIQRVLKPSGVFICYHFPNRHSVIERLASTLPRKFSHSWKFDADQIRALCREAQLEIVHLSRYGLLPRNSARFWPGSARESRRVAAWWDWLDAALARPFGRVAQNYCFVARTRGAARPLSG